MTVQPLRKEISIGEGNLIIETGKIARQAGGAAVMRLGDTVVLVTAVANPEPREWIG